MNYQSFASVIRKYKRNGQIKLFETYKGIKKALNSEHKRFMIEIIDEGCYKL